MAAPTSPASQVTVFPQQDPTLSRMRIDDDYVGEFALESAEAAKEEMEYRHGKMVEKEHEQEDLRKEMEQFKIKREKYYEAYKRAKEDLDNIENNIKGVDSDFKYSSKEYKMHRALHRKAEEVLKAYQEDPAKLGSRRKKDRGRSKSSESSTESPRSKRRARSKSANKIPSKFMDLDGNLQQSKQEEERKPGGVSSSSKDGAPPPPRASSGERRPPAERTLKSREERRRERDEAGKYSEDRCFNCGDKGHHGWKCPKPLTKERCYNCGEMGHHSRECQAPKKGSVWSDGKGSSGKSSGDGGRSVFDHNSRDPEQVRKGRGKGQEYFPECSDGCTLEIEGIPPKINEEEFMPYLLSGGKLEWGWNHKNICAVNVLRSVCPTVDRMYSNKGKAYFKFMNAEVMRKWALEFDEAEIVAKRSGVNFKIQVRKARQDIVSYHPRHFGPTYVRVWDDVFNVLPREAEETVRA